MIVHFIFNLSIIDGLLLNNKNVIINCFFNNFKNFKLCHKIKKKYLYLV